MGREKATHAAQAQALATTHSTGLVPLVLVGGRWEETKVLVGNDDSTAKVYMVFGNELVEVTSKYNPEAPIWAVRQQAMRRHGHKFGKVDGFTRHAAKSVGLAPRRLTDIIAHKSMAFLDEGTKDRNYTGTQWTRATITSDLLAGYAEGNQVRQAAAAEFES